jgi:hypothetical protein
MSAKTVNAKGSATKMKRFFEIVEKFNPVNYGDMKTGNKYNTDREVIYESIQDTSIVHFVFTDKKTVGKVLDELHKAELGTSVVVSGLINITDQLCRQAGLTMHTVEYSGRVMGKTELLPEMPVLDITTMCGHGMVASNLVREMVRKIKKGKLSLEEAGVELAKPCQCGVFNPKRAEMLLQKFL